MAFYKWVRPRFPWVFERNIFDPQNILFRFNVSKAWRKRYQQVFQTFWDHYVVQPFTWCLRQKSTLIRSILTYWSDVWGLSKAGLDVVDKVFLNFARCTLNVIATTCNAIVYGECGRYPLSVFCHINVLCYVHRLLTMPGESVSYVRHPAWSWIHDIGHKGIRAGSDLWYRYEFLCCAHRKTI